MNFWKEFLSKRTLAERLILGFTLLITTVASVYVFAVTQTIEFTERSLMSTFMEDEFKYLAFEYDRGELDRLPRGVLLFGDGPDLQPLLPRFRPIHGYKELDDDPAVFVYRDNTPAGTDMALVLDQAGFEAHETRIHAAVLLSLLAVLLLAGLVSWRLSRMVMRPVERLTEEMRLAAGSEGYRPVRMLEGLPDDDAVGNLARICDEALRSLHEALMREKAFTGDVSYELRTPLTVIETSAEILADGPLQPAQRRALERIERNACAMRSLLEVFLALARMSQERSQEHAKPDEVLQDLTAEWAERTRAQSGAPRFLEPFVIAPCTEKVPSIYFETILNNLFKNAAAYAGPGIVAAALDGDVVWVADSGPGIPAAVRPAVFKAFVRGSESGDGAGLGLSISHRIAQRSGWTLAASDADALPAAVQACFRAEGLTPGAVFRLDLHVQFVRSDSAAGAAEG